MGMGMGMYVCTQSVIFTREVTGKEQAKLL